MSRGRLGVARLCIEPLARALAWGPLFVGGVAALTLVGYLRADHVNVGASIGGLRSGAMMTAAGAAFALDDVASPTLAGSPTPLFVRTGIRLGLALAGYLGVWSCLLAVTGPAALPWAVALSVEAAGMIALTLGAGSVAQRWAPNGLGGLAGGPVLLFTLLGSLVVQRSGPRWVRLLPPAPGDPTWVPAHFRWVLLSALGATAIVVTQWDRGRSAR